METVEGPRTYTIPEVAALLGRPYRYVQEDVRRGVLEAVKRTDGRIGRGVHRYSISPEALEKYRFRKERKLRRDETPRERLYAGYLFAPDAAILSGNPLSAVREAIYRGSLPGWRIRRPGTAPECLVDLNDLYHWMRQRTTWKDRQRAEFAVPICTVPVIPTIEGVRVEPVVPRPRVPRKERAAAGAE